MQTIDDRVDWALWFYWIMATTLGWLLGKLLFVGISMVASGVAIAAFQWAVLYKRIHNAWRWAVLSSLIWIAITILLQIAAPTAMTAFIGPLLGLVLGIAQWYLLKQVVEWAGWWIIISLLAWTTGLTIIPGLLTSGALPGALTGLTLVILFRYASPKTRYL